MLFSHWWDERNKNMDKIERDEKDTEIKILKEAIASMQNEQTVALNNSSAIIEGMNDTLEQAKAQLTEVYDERNSLKELLLGTLQELIIWSTAMGITDSPNLNKLEETIAALEEY